MPRGFTLLEVLIVVAILGIIGALGLTVGFESYGGTLFRSDEDTLRTALLHARAEAQSGVCAASGCTAPTAHGVRIVGNTYIVFEGESYAARSSGEDEVLDGSARVMRAGLTEVVFEPLTAQVNVPGDFVLTDAQHTSTTTVNSEGAIFWSK
jgi:prepilin-type N-terminal cleavage/methylation domain-containing protein